MAADEQTPDGAARLLCAAREGDLAAWDRLVRLLLDDFHRAAEDLMGSERVDHTLQPTALVNEALIKVIEGGFIADARDREHLFRAVAQAMRQVLSDHRRRRAARKRAGGGRRRPFDDVLDRLASTQRIDLGALDEALDRLATVDARACLVTTFHSFLGLSIPRVAEVLEISRATAERDWMFARAWLRDQLRPEDEV